MPVLNRKVGATRDIKELDRSVSTCNYDLILILFGPSGVVLGILGVESVRSVSSFPDLLLRIVA